MSLFENSFDMIGEVLPRKINVWITTRGTFNIWRSDIKATCTYTTNTRIWLFF